MKFYPNSLNGFQLTSEHGIALTNVSRDIIQKIYNQELWFLRITRRLIMIYKYMKFHRNACILNGFLGRTRFVDGQTDIRTDRQTHGVKQYVSLPCRGGGGGGETTNVYFRANRERKSEKYIYIKKFVIR